MRKKRELETAKHRTERVEREATRRIEQASAEDKAIDAAVKQSIKLYGP